MNLRLSSATSILCLGLAGAADAAALEIAATIPDLAALAKAVGGERVKVTTLAPPNQDPHYVDPRPSLMLPLSRADLLLVNGLELEVGWLPPLLVNARNPKVQLGAAGYLDTSLFVNRLQVPTGRIDRAMGDVHPGGNPHFLHDPRQARKVAAAIADRLSRLDREGAEVYAKNLQTLDAELAALINREAARFRALPPEKRRVTTYHQSLTYLTDWLGLEEVATIEPRPGIPPTPSHVAEVLKAMRATGTRVIVQEDFYQRGPAETLAKLTKGELVIISGGTHFDKGQSYVARMKEIAEKLHHALTR